MLRVQSWLTEGTETGPLQNDVLRVQFPGADRLARSFALRVILGDTRGRAVGRKNNDLDRSASQGLVGLWQRGA